MTVMDWDEGVVNGFVVNVLKMEQYEDQIYGMSAFHLLTSGQNIDTLSSNPCVLWQCADRQNTG